MKDNAFVSIVRKAVKEEFDSSPRVGKLENRMDGLETSMDRLERRMNSLETGFDNFKEEIKAAFTQHRSEVMTAMDKIVGLFGRHEEEHQILNGRHKQILEIDDRVEKLENIHPEYQHLTA